MTWAQLSTACLTEAEMQGDPTDHSTVCLDIGEEILKGLCHSYNLDLDFLLVDQPLVITDATVNYVPLPSVPPLIRLAEEKCIFQLDPTDTPPCQNILLKPVINPSQRRLYWGNPRYYWIAPSSTPDVVGNLYFAPWSDIVVGQQLLISYYPLRTIAVDYATANLPNRLIQIMKPAIIQRLLLYKDSKKASAFGISDKRIREML